MVEAFQNRHQPVNREPVQLDSTDARKVRGSDRPLGLPLVDHVEGDIWEVRTKLENRIARVLFVVESDAMILLHGFIKNDQQTPKPDLDVAKDRLKRLRGYR